MATNFCWRRALLPALGLCLVAGSLHPDRPADIRIPIQDAGKAIYLRTCAACHGQDARGVPGLGKDLVDSEFVRQLSDEELVAFIERGRSVDDSLNTTGVPMPPRGGNASLTREDLRMVVTYLRSLQLP